MARDKCVASFVSDLVTAIEIGFLKIKYSATFNTAWQKHGIDGCGVAVVGGAIKAKTAAICLSIVSMVRMFKQPNTC